MNQQNGASLVLGLRREAGQNPEPSPLNCIVLDFDGTLTDADRHASAFQDASKQELALRLGVEANEMESLWQRTEQQIRRTGTDPGWEVDGRLVCSAIGDPYLLANSICLSLLEEREWGDNAQERRSLVFEIHRTSYLRVPPPFRKETGAVLDELTKRVPVLCIVTNSSTETVVRLLQQTPLGATGALRVQGGASKFTVETRALHPRLRQVPESILIPPRQRPVYLHRVRYLELLEQLWTETGTSPETTLVVGDLFELDLAMPAVLGAAIHLVTRAGTLEADKRAVEYFARGESGADLWSVLKRLDTSQ